MNSLVIEQILRECTFTGLRVDVAPYVKYRENESPNPKVLHQMEHLIESLETDGRVHPKFGRTTDTGRFIFKQPNLLVLGRDSKPMIVPDEGHVMMEVYFKHSELRAAQVLSGDTDFLALFDQPDIHQYMADKLNIGRNAAKHTVFNALYNIRYVPFTKEYLACFPVLEGWVAVNSYARNTSRQLQRKVVDAVDIAMPTVYKLLKDTKARIACPSHDGMYLSCPVDAQESVTALVKYAMTPNLLNAEVEVRSSTSMLTW